MVSATTQAILLLTTHLTKNGPQAAQPLTPAEWGRFARWLQEQSLTPDRLLHESLQSILEGWRDTTITMERIEALLERGSALAFALEKWLRGGLWVITRADPDYPARLKQRLGKQAPAVLFGAGNRNLLRQGGVAVVGSRHIEASDLQYSRELGALLADCGYSVISGGAKGVDEAAMLGALEAEGTAVGALSNDLLRACSSQKYRDFLRQKSLALISPFNPEAGFDVGNAMQRNKYIYCLSDAAVVVHSGREGGTWAGATENLKKGWVPLWVKRSDDEKAGNRFLVQQGARWLSDAVREIDGDMLVKSEARQNLLAIDQSQADQTDSGDSYERSGETTPMSEIEAGVGNAREMDKAVKEESFPYSAAKSFADTTFYEFFLAKVQQLCRDKAVSVEELAQKLELQKSQVNLWLKKALSDGLLVKLNKPAGYQWKKGKQEVLPLD